MNGRICLALILSTSWISNKWVIVYISFTCSAHQVVLVHSEIGAGPRVMYVLLLFTSTFEHFLDLGTQKTGCYLFLTIGCLRICIPGSDTCIEILVQDGWHCVLRLDIGSSWRRNDLLVIPVVCWRAHAYLLPGVVVFTISVDDLFSFVIDFNGFFILACFFLSGWFKYLIVYNDLLSGSCTSVAELVVWASINNWNGLINFVPLSICHQVRNSCFLSDGPLFFKVLFLLYYR